MQVHRRLVIYVQGYDPRGLPEYYRMFRREYRRACELYGLQGKVGRIEDDAGRFRTHWDVRTDGPGWHVETQYQFLRWEDIIRKDFAQPSWWKLVNMLRIMSVVIGEGIPARIMKAHWRFGLFILYPLFLTLAWLLLGAATGYMGAKALEIAGVPQAVAVAAGIVTALGIFALLIWRTEQRTYLLYLCDDIIATHEFSRRQRPEWEERMAQFATSVVEAVRAADADEIIIVGHSSGSFLAVDVLDRALTLDPDLGKNLRRPHARLRLLTLGANLPIVGFPKPAQWFRDRIRRLALNGDIDWVDYQSRHDIMNFWPFDPVTGHGIELGDARRNPTVVAISFRDIWKGEFARRRWRFFEAHFQFLRANEKRGAAFDYYLICCGPLDLMTRARKPAEAIAHMEQARELPGTGQLV